MMMVGAIAASMSSRSPCVSDFLMSMKSPSDNGRRTCSPLTNRDRPICRIPHGLPELRPQYPVVQFDVLDGPPPLALLVERHKEERAARELEGIKCHDTRPQTPLPGFRNRD